MKHSVFLNFPFDESYKKIFIGLIASLVSLSRTPRSVLEIPEDGVGRLARLCRLVAECRVSIHDLSRVGMPARFNMPFELGLACATAQQNPNRYGFFILEKVNFRFDQTLSDLKGRDPIIHHGAQRDVINGILSELSVRGQHVDPQTVGRVARRLSRAVNEYYHKTHQRKFYTRMMFNFSVAAAAKICVEEGLLRA